jgi:hypothetical protein
MYCVLLCIFSLVTPTPVSSDDQSGVIMDDVWQLSMHAMTGDIISEFQVSLLL